MEVIQIGKEEVKLFVDGMSLYTEDFNNVARRLPELLKKFIKVAGDTSNIQKSADKYIKIHLSSCPHPLVLFLWRA